MPLKHFPTPAPCEYDVDKLDKSVLQSGGFIRGYTFGHPNASSKTSHTPGMFHICCLINLKCSIIL